MESRSPISPQPVLLTKQLTSSIIAVRFEHIGPRYRFRILLQRFRFDFILAECKDIDRVPWWLIAQSQQKELVDFARRNGLKIVEEQEHAQAHGTSDH